jgi:hypothetical protein
MRLPQSDFGVRSIATSNDVHHNRLHTVRVWSSDS